MSKTLSSRGLSPKEALSPDLISTQRHSDEVMNQHTIATLPTGGLQIIHITHGRIRIRATDGSLNSRLEPVSQYLKQCKGVKEVSTNEQTSSLVVTFDKNQLTLPQILAILGKLNIHRSPTSPESGSSKDPFAAWKSPDFWIEQTISFIPLMTGLAVTGGLGVSGLASIPVYMITADATRRVIDYLEPQIAKLDSNKQSQPHNKTGDRQSAKPNTTTKPVVEPVKQDVTPSANIAYTVVHTIPGRIRFHVPRIAQDHAYAQRLEKLLKTEAQVTKVRMNCDAASIAIAFQPGEIAINHWVKLMELALETNLPTPVVQNIEQQQPLEQITQPVVSADTTETAVKSNNLNISSLWADMKPAAMSCSLAYMANFPL
jgi:Heavy metal associated domain 2